MSIADTKPNWYPDADVVATERGWCYTKNHNEVLVAINHLDDRIAAETPPLQPET